jgi:Uma2 family endonuclease
MKRTTLAPWAEPAPGARFPLSADDLSLLPGDAWRYELVEGRLVRMPPPGGEHGAIAAHLNAIVWIHARNNHLGTVLSSETGFLLSQPGQPDTVLAPDVAFVRAEHVPAPDSPDRSGYWRVAPDLVAEVVSPSQFRPEMADKARLWLESGARLVWIVWPRDRQVDVWLPGHDEPAATLGVSDQLDGRDVLPGFTYPLADLFA